MKNEEIGLSVRAMRKRCGWTQEKLAGETNLSVQAISNIERGLSEPTVTTLRVIANVMGYPMTDFFEEKGVRGDTKLSVERPIRTKSKTVRKTKKAEDNVIRVDQLRALLQREIQSLSVDELESVLHHIQGIRRFHR